jgi:hypothetical protein
MAGAAAAMAAWPMGLAGQRSGRNGLGRATGSARSVGCFSFFLNLFLMRKQIPEKSRNCLKARKILEID